MSRHTSRTVTYRNGNSPLLPHRRVFDGGLGLRYASDTEIENGIPTRRIGENELAGIQLLSDGGTWTMIADGVITRGSPVYRATQGRVSAGGTSQIGRAETSSAADGDEIEIFITANTGGGGGGGTVDSRLAEDLGVWDATTAVPSVGPQGGFYHVSKPLANQTVNFVGGSGTVTISSAGRIWTDGIAWFWEPFGGSNSVTNVANLAALNAIADQREGDEAKLSAITSNGLRYIYNDGSWEPSSLVVTEPVASVPTIDLVNEQVVLVAGQGWFRNETGVGWVQVSGSGEGSGGGTGDEWEDIELAWSSDGTTATLTLPSAPPNPKLVTFFPTNRALVWRGDYEVAIAGATATADALDLAIADTDTVEVRFRK